MKKIRSLKSLSTCNIYSIRQNFQNIVLGFILLFRVNNCFEFLNFKLFLQGNFYNILLFLNLYFFKFTIRFLIVIFVITIHFINHLSFIFK